MANLGKRTPFTMPMAFIVPGDNLHQTNVNLNVLRSVYSKTFLKRPLKNRQTKLLMADGSPMKVESIAECSLYFWPALSDTRS